MVSFKLLTVFNVTSFHPYKKSDVIYRAFYMGILPAYIIILYADASLARFLRRLVGFTYTTKSSYTTI